MLSWLHPTRIPKYSWLHHPRFSRANISATLANYSTRFIYIVPNIKISVYAKNQICRCPTYHTKRAVLIRSLRRRPYRMKPTAVGFISLTTVNLGLRREITTDCPGLVSLPFGPVPTASSLVGWMFAEEPVMTWHWAPAGWWQKMLKLTLIWVSLCCSYIISLGNLFASGILTWSHGNTWNHCVVWVSTAEGVGMQLAVWHKPPKIR